MDIEGLADFIMLADCKSFSKAAILRNVTQPAFSRRIKNLEAVLTTELIDRSSKNFKLTMAGERFLVHATNLVEISKRAIDDTKSLITRLHEPVYIAAPAYLSKTFFPLWYKAMQKSVSNLNMRISHQRGSNAVDDLHKGLADFALIMRTAKVDPCYNLEELQFSVVGEDKMVAVRSRQCVNKDKLLMYEQGSYMNSCAEYVLGDNHVKGQVVFESSSTGLLKEMAIAGFGVSVLPESIVEDDLKQGYLVLAEETLSLPCSILLVRAKQLSSKKAEKLWAGNAIQPSKLRE